MKNSPVYDPTTDYYNKNAKAWTKLHDKQDFWDKPLKIFKELLPVGSRVLEIGFGPCRDAIQLINAGYKYVGIDPSQAMTELAGLSELNGEFIQLAAENLNFIDEFEGLWTVASLIHIPKSKIGEVLQKINLAMKNEAIGFITMKKYVDTDGSPDERFETDEFGTRLFSYWTLEDFTDLLEQNGFELIVEVEEEYVSPKTTWLKFFVRKVPDVNYSSP